MASSNALLRTLLLVSTGAVVGGATAWFVSELFREPEGAADLEGVARLVERVERIEERVSVGDQAQRAPRARDRVAADTSGPQTSPSGDRASAISGIEGLGRASVGASSDPDNGDGAIPREPPPEFVNLVRSAIEEIKRQDAEGSVEKRVADQRRKYLYEVDKKLHNYRDQLGLTDEQVGAFRSAAVAGYDERLQAQLDGKPQAELQALDRKRHREFRDVIGGAAYREFRKLELDAAARPTIVSIAGQAGVDREQRDRIERLLDEHIEGLVDLDVKLRTEELSDEERGTIHERMQGANRSAWDRLRGSILDADQRERVPKRLR